MGELLGPLVVDGEAAVEVSAFAALALGLVFVSSGREEVVMNVLQVGQLGVLVSWECGASVGVG